MSICPFSCSTRSALIPQSGSSRSPSRTVILRRSASIPPSRSTVGRTGGGFTISEKKRCSPDTFFFRRTCTIRCRSSGNRSRIIARNTFPTNPVPPINSIVHFRNASTAEMSPVPCSAGGGPDSYSPRTAFHRQGVRDCISEPLQVAGTAETWTKLREARGWASRFVSLYGEGDASDSSPRDTRPTTASAHQRNCPRTRRIVRGRCLPVAHIRGCFSPFRFPQEEGAAHDLLQCGFET